MRYYLVFADLLAQDVLNSSAMMHSSTRTNVDKRNCLFRVIAYSGGHEYNHPHAGVACHSIWAWLSHAMIQLVDDGYHI